MISPVLKYGQKFSLTTTADNNENVVSIKVSLSAKDVIFIFSRMTSLPNAYLFIYFILFKSSFENLQCSVYVCCFSWVLTFCKSSIWSYRRWNLRSLIYCSNSCTSLHFKTLKSVTKTLKIRPYMFRSPLNPFSRGPWPYIAMLLNWNFDLHSL